MKTSTALMCVRQDCARGVASLRQRMRERALDEGMPRIWMESLEARRMLSDGFGVNGWTSAAFKVPVGHAFPIAMAAAPDGKIYVVGDAGASSADWGIARFNVDGTPDTSFGSDAAGTEIFSLGQCSIPDHVLPQADGKIIVTGETD